MSSISLPPTSGVGNPTIHVGLIVNTKDGKSTNLRVIPFILYALTTDIDNYITNSISNVVEATRVAGLAQHKDATTANITGPDTFVPAIFFNPTDYSITAVTYNRDGSIDPTTDFNLKLVKIPPEFVKNLTGISNPKDYAEQILLVTTVLKYIYDTLRSEQKRLNLAAQQNIDAIDRNNLTSNLKQIIDKVKRSSSFTSLKDVPDAKSEVEYLSFYPNDDDNPIVASPETATDQESIKVLYTIFTYYLKAIKEEELRPQLGGGFKNRKSRRRISKKSRKSKNIRRSRSSNKFRRSKKRRIMKRRRTRK